MKGIPMDGDAISDSNQATQRRVDAVLLRCAAGFLVVAGICLLLAVVAPFVAAFRERRIDTFTMQLTVVVAVISAVLGLILARAARTGLARDAGIILPADAAQYLGPALQKSADPIGDWTRLAGLVGGTGVFRKLEFSGMPLATILMTVLFSLLSLSFHAFHMTDATAWVPDEFSKELAKAFLDMAKLTLGAFIGSFVTKATTRDTEVGRGAAAAAVTALAATPGGGTGGTSGTARIGGPDIADAAAAGAGAGAAAGAEAARAGGGDAAVGADAGAKAGVDAGTKTGIEAGTKVGIDSGTKVGVDSGTKVGVDAGTEVGIIEVTKPGPG